MHSDAGREMPDLPKADQVEPISDTVRLVQEQQKSRTGHTLAWVLQAD